MLRVIVEAAHTQRLIRVSLKSRKVYIGLITQEQCEPAESENLVIIPVYSGYRDKDDLRMIINCNYSSVYKKLGIFNNNQLSVDELNRLDEMRTSIRYSEIESIAMFNDELYEQFEGNKMLSS